MQCDIGAIEFQPARIFGGTSGSADCHCQSTSGLSGHFGDLHAAALALGLIGVQSLQQAIKNIAMEMKTQSESDRMRRVQ